MGPSYRILAPEGLNIGTKEELKEPTIIGLSGSSTTHTTNTEMGMATGQTPETHSTSEDKRAERLTGTPQSGRDVAETLRREKSGHTGAKTQEGVERINLNS